MTKAQQRAIALAVARELLPVMGIQPEMVHADEAMKVLDELFYTQPQSVAWQWWSTANQCQIDLFIDEWEDWREEQLAKCPICQRERECMDCVFCDACSALFEGRVSTTAM